MFIHQPVHQDRILSELNPVDLPDSTRDRLEDEDITTLLRIRDSRHPYAREIWEHWAGEEEEPHEFTSVRLFQPHTQDAGGEFILVLESGSPDTCEPSPYGKKVYLPFRPGDVFSSFNSGRLHPIYHWLLNDMRDKLNLPTRPDEEHLDAFTREFYTSESTSPSETARLYVNLVLGIGALRGIDSRWLLTPCMNYVHLEEEEELALQIAQLFHRLSVIDTQFVSNRPIPSMVVLPAGCPRSGKSTYVDLLAKVFLHQWPADIVGYVPAFPSLDVHSPTRPADRLQGITPGEYERLLELIPRVPQKLVTQTLVADICMKSLGIPLSLSADPSNAAVNMTPKLFVCDPPPFTIQRGENEYPEMEVYKGPNGEDVELPRLLYDDAPLDGIDYTLLIPLILSDLAIPIDTTPSVCLRSLARWTKVSEDELLSIQNLREITDGELDRNHLLHRLRDPRDENVGEYMYHAMAGNILAALIEKIRLHEKYTHRLLSFIITDLASNPQHLQRKYGVDPKVITTLRSKPPRTLVEEGHGLSAWNTMNRVLQCFT